jgi:CHAT domain-containing protein
VKIPAARPSNQLSKAPLAESGPKGDVSMTDVATALSTRCRKALFVFLLMMSSGCRRQESASERLRTLAPRTPRPIEARLSGFDWQAMRLPRATPSGLLDPARLELAGAASTVIQSLANDSSAHSRHEAGAAYLLIEHDRDAVDALESAVLQEPREAACWNDLSAARYTLAVREKRPQELPEALADADHALKLKAGYPDALFNRALIVEALGITEAARRAWQRYMETDPSTHWSNEAASHLGRLSVVTTRDVFQHQLDLASRALRAGNDGPIVALARNFPQEARTWSEGPLLANWADAIRSGKTAKAAETLAVVRKLGAAVAEFNHDAFVADAVAVIDAATADPRRLQMVAEAHAAYRDGRLLYSKRRVLDAQEHLRQAADLFARSGDNPMSLASAFYLGNGLYDSNQPVAAARAFEELEGHIDHNRYPGLLGQIGWEQTLCQNSQGEWDTAIHTASASRKIFSDMGETENRAEMDLLLASNFNHASQSAAAWKARIEAFPVLSRAGSADRIRNSLVSGLNAEAQSGNVEAALSLGDVALNDLLHSKQPMAVPMVEASRAEALTKLGDARAARSAIQRARESARAIPDEEVRRRTSASIDIAEGVVERSIDPRLSLRLLDAAVAFYTARHGNAWLPRAYLERGRTHVQAKDDTAALVDFETGLREVDLQRSTILNRELRGTFYDTEPDLFSETIELLLRRGDTERAFEFSDAARARSVYEQLGHGRTADTTTAAEVQRAMPPSTAIVEYALLHNSIEVFYFTSSHSGAVRIEASPLAVRALTERFDDLLQHRGDLEAVQREASALHRVLIAPVAADLAGVTRLIVIPDRDLHAIPFTALYDAARRRYVVEDFDVSVAPNAGAIVQQRGPLKLSPVLVVGDPHDEGGPSLPEAAREAGTIAEMYDSATLLKGENANCARFIAAARRSGLIHYAGHAESDSADPFGALHLVADGAHRTGDLDANTIAGLHLSNAPLVILAACGTIRGNAEHVEGMPSIARAFLAAGARGVIGTLWEVDDVTVAPLFRRVHIELCNGASPSAALRTAQISAAHDPDPNVRHPATWAPIELLGYSNQ